MNRLGTYFLFLLLSFGLASAVVAQVADASVCEVLANPALFDGRVIRNAHLRGLLRQVLPTALRMLESGEMLVEIAELNAPKQTV